MPGSVPPSFTSSRVQRASRLNGLEQARLQQRLMLLEKAKLRQTRLTNQEIRITASLLGFIVNCSGHSPEGQGPANQQQEEDCQQQPEEPFFLYGERVASRKVRRMPRPLSAWERSPLRQAAADGQSWDTVTGRSPGDRTMLSSRPKSSPAKGPRCSSVGAEDGLRRGRTTEDRSPSCSNSLDSSACRRLTGEVDRVPPAGSVVPRAWDDDDEMHEVTKRILKAQQQKQQHQDLLPRQGGWRPSSVRSMVRRSASSDASFTAYVSFPSPPVVLTSPTPVFTQNVVPAILTTRQKRAKDRTLEAKVQGN